MAGQNAKGLQRIINAYGYSMAGFKACYKHEEAFRQELYGLVVLIPLGLWLGESGIERALLVGSLLLIPLVELLNSAIEQWLIVLVARSMNSPAVPRISVPPRFFW